MAEKKRLTDEDHALLHELGIEVEFNKIALQTSREERIITGFAEIQRFVDEQRRLPEHGENNDIFERLYAIRLDRIRSLEECVDILKNIDYQSLLSNNYEMGVQNDLSDDDLLVQLGVEENMENSITQLKHVKSRAEKKVAEEIANRIRCEDFERFNPLFKAVKTDIDNGYRTVIEFRKDAGFTKTTLKQGQFIILGGQISYIAEIGDVIKAPNGEDDARLRVIYINGTESNILLRSLVRAMYKDETSRFITNSNLGPLFSVENSDNDLPSGKIYVLRSLSEHQFVKKHRDVVHKIGVTGGSISKRLGNAKNDPTFLMADVEVISIYELANINKMKIEKVIHNFFASSKLDIEMRDRFGKLVKAKEWFVVPIFIIDEMVKKIIDGTISLYFYDSESVELKLISQNL